MRKELEQIKKIEEYLNGTMPAGERAAFDEALTRDAGLREEVELQRELTKGLQRIALQDRVRMARRHYWRSRYLKKWGGLGSGFVVLVVAVVLLAGRKDRTGVGGKEGVPGKARAATGSVISAPADSVARRKDSAVLLPPVVPALLGPAAPERRIPVQVYSVNASADTSVVTKGGIVFAIPAGSLLDAEGKVIDGLVDLVVREAIDPVTILRSGLSTKSGDRWLETAGMFDAEASQQGRPVRINPAIPIFARIPSDSLVKDMQLFTGERKVDGSIDWVNPRSPERFLIPVDIHLLDFYPPHYLDSIGHWGYAAGNKDFTDSLYYSLARFFVPGDDKGSPYLMPGQAKRPAGSSLVTDSVAYKSDRTPVLNCGINPAKIKTIWSESFQKTLIATREFEERIAFIHQSADPNLLDLYPIHLDLPISAIDSMAARKSSGTIRQAFLSFAARHEGRVAINVRQMELLRRYYDKKTKEYTAAITRAQQEFWQRQADLDQTAQKRTNAYWQNEWERQSRLLKDQYGLSKQYAYTVSLLELGWHNMDKYTPMMSSNYVSSRSIVFRIANAREYDGVLCYLLPDKMNSFIRIYDQGGVYQERLWAGMNYSFVAIGYKGDSSFVYTQTNFQPGEYPAVILYPINKANLDSLLNSLAPASSAGDLRQEIDYQAFRVQDNKRVLQNLQRQALTDRVIRVVFPCYQPQREDFDVPAK